MLSQLLLYQAYQQLFRAMEIHLINLSHYVPTCIHGYMTT